MKNICFFNSIRFWGGGEKLHLEYAIEFHKKNYNVSLASSCNSPLWLKATSMGLKTLKVSVGNLSFLNPIKMLKLISMYRKNEIDTVIFSTSQDLKAGGISAKLAGVKNIVYLRGLAVPIKSSPINRYIFNSVLTHIVANSEETRRSILKNLGPYINPEKVKTIYHGIEPKLLENREDNKLNEITERAQGVILGNAGRLTPQKGQQHLIEVAKRLKAQNLDFTLFIAGTGKMESELQAMISENDLEKEVVLLGFVKDMEAFMNSIDIFLLSSIWEGFGYVLVEAMIKSKPTVAFDISSNPEIVLDGETGLLVTYPDVDDFAEKVRLLIDDEDLRKQLGNAGRQSVLNRFILADRVTEFEQALL